MKKTLLILGEYGTDDLNKNIKRLQKESKKINLPYKTMSYEQLFKNNKKDIFTNNLKAMFFFPFKFWDENCEIPQNTSVYGTSKESYNLFNQFWQDVKGTLEKKFSDKKISYVINPDYAALDRDKIAVNNLLRKKGVSTTNIIQKNLKEIIELSKEKGIFIKARYGALGKGISYLSPKGWFTNYKVGGKNNIENYPDIGKWEFSNITGNKEFIRKLLDLEVIVEEEVKSPQLNPEKKFDMRVYSLYGNVPHMFIRENAESKIITNFSQGGQVNHRYYRALSKKTIALASNTALKASKAFNSNFMGIDVIFDKNLENPKVLEVQTFTGFPDIRYCNLTKLLAHEIKKKD